MGNSTTSLVSLYDSLKAKGIFDPRDQPGGVGLRLALDIANDVMSEIIAERFNPKWNESIATPFYLNSSQQDYPQLGLVNIGWGTHVDVVDINNTSLPKPTNNPVTMTFVRDLARTSASMWPPNQICWKYNQNLAYGTWPGAGVTYNPLITTGPVLKNPSMSMKDSNGNILIVTLAPNASGVTGNVTPVLPVNSAEGTVFMDGTVPWTVVAPMSQGFRVYPLPGATGPVYQITPYYQVLLQKLTQLTAMINPIPDDHRYIYRHGLEISCKRASPNPNERAEGLKEHPLWLGALAKLLKQDNREPDTYAAFPASQVVEGVYGWSGRRNPNDPSQPY